MKKISRPAGGVPLVRHTPEQLNSALEVLRRGSGPIAIDTERAAMYRFDDRAYLIQVRREEAGSFLLDPTTQPELIASWQNELLADVPWLLHAAHTDLPALLALGWHPPQLLDTQIAATLLGCRRIGLSPLLEEFLHISIPKDKGDANWSQRPLTKELLAYAALDVEFLLQMHEVMLEELDDLGRLEWYAQECEHVRQQATPLRDPEWTDMKGARFLRTGSRAAIVAKALFEERTRIARAGDIPPERLLPSKSIVAIAQLRHKEAARQLRAEVMNPSRGLGAERLNAYRHAVTLHSFLDALSHAHATKLERRKVAATDCPEDTTDKTAPHRRLRPDAKTWEAEHPTAWATLEILRETAQELSEDFELKADAIIVTRQMTAAAWELSQSLHSSDRATHDVDWMEDCLGELLEHVGCRPWQIELVLNNAIPYLANEFLEASG